MPEPELESTQPRSIGLSSDMRRQLLDPAAWQPGLEKYAAAVHLAIALVDADGRLLGECINPQLLWSLLRAQKPVRPGECPLALAPPISCLCVAEALEKGAMVRARDRTGLVHFTVPLVLGEHKLGALIAGQVFDRYPEQVALEHMARKFGLLPTLAWQRARLERPIRPATLQVYAELLATLGRTFLQTRFNVLTEEKRLAEMTRLRDRLEQRTQELAERDHRKDLFLAMLSHELRNPLGAINNAIHVLNESGVPAAQRIEAQAVISRQVNHLSRLLDDLLNVSRITSGKMDLKTQSVDLKEVISRCVESFRPAIEAQRHGVFTTLGEEAAVVEGDPVRLEQVISNLLGNAIKYTPPGGYIRLSVQRDGDEVVFRIRDSGIGIEPDMLSDIFELFTQRKSPGPHEEGGLGLGLWLARTLVMMHGGRVMASSAGPNQGSEFIVRLPALRVPKDEWPPAAKEREKPANVRRHILIIDDDADNRNMLETLLKLEGHAVETASSGRQGIERMLAHPPEVALVDIGLPDLNGYQVAQQVRAAPEGSKIFLVACTGYGQSEDRAHALEAGFNAHLVKPVDPEQIWSLLADVAASAEAP